MTRRFTLTRRLVGFSIVLAMVVIMLGAWTRLSDAGLGCPDWPGCYGHLVVPEKDHQLERAAALFPEHTVEAHKAWPEMIHRYFAGTLGLLIYAIAFFSWRQRKQGHPVILPTFLAIWVTWQAALGMWTVTLKLWPIVVMAHLLGGFITLVGLAILHLNISFPEIHVEVQKRTRLLAKIAAAVVFVQIMLGGWVSANYAALACTEFPICHAGWTEHADFAKGFEPHYPGEKNYEFGLLSPEARVAVHASHRIGAYTTFAVMTLLIFWLWREKAAFAKLFAPVLAVVLIVQMSLGIANVVMHLPLNVAVAHNAVGALLLLTIAILNVVLIRGRQRAQT